jgi:predicted dehydrogenase
MQVLRVGIIGFGLSGKVFHFPFLLTNPKFTLVAVVERSKNESQQFAIRHNIDIIIYRTVEEICQDSTIDVIVVCSPIAMHYEHAKIALLSGKHVLVEKAFTCDSSQAMELFRLAASLNLVISPYQNRRYDSDFITLQRILPSLGDIVEYNGYYNRYSPNIRFHSWKDTVPNSGGNMFSLGSHMIDQCVLLFGIPYQIYSDIQCQRINGIIDDNFEIHLYYYMSNSQNNQNNVCCTGLDEKSTYIHRNTFHAIVKGSLLTRNHNIRYMVHGRKGSWIKCGVDGQESYLTNCDNLPNYDSFIRTKHDMDTYLCSRDESKNTSTIDMDDNNDDFTSTLPNVDISNLPPNIHTNEIGYLEPIKQWGKLTNEDGSEMSVVPSIGSYHIFYDQFYDSVLSCMNSSNEECNLHYTTNNNSSKTGIETYIPYDILTIDERNIKRVVSPLHAIAVIRILELSKISSTEGRVVPFTWY